MKGRFFNVMKS